LEKIKRGENMETEVYARQEDLRLNIPASATVVGVGGVGSWVALDLSLLGVKKLVLIDPDIVESTNLNRTPFKETQIGEPKVVAISSLIKERRSATETIPINKWVENLTKNEIKMATTDIIYDCRDTTGKLPFKSQPVITGGYNGKSITIQILPNQKFGWGEATRYTITPSYVVPPQLIAVLLVSALEQPPEFFSKSKYITFTSDEILPSLIKSFTGVGNND
jgi:predicted ThiF/HesA family dinucleotide-utilizing enzyme